MINRSKLNYKLRYVHRYPILIASAPNGFGKTTGLQAYFNQQPAHTCWFSMYGQDDEDWAWTSVMNHLAEWLGVEVQFSSIPTTRKMIDTYLQTIIPLLETPLFIIFDDVQIQSFSKHLHFLSMYSYIPHQNLHFVIVTMDSTDQLIPYDFANKIMMLHTDDFAFSEKETYQLCHLEIPSLSQQEKEFLYTYTKGWIFALSLMLKSYKQSGNFHDHTSIHSLVQHVLYNKLNEDVKYNLIKLSLLKVFTLSFAYEICQHKDTMQLLIQMEKEKQFIQKIDVDKYEFTPLFKEFLLTHLLTSTIDIKELHQTIGTCYFQHNQPLYAIELFLNIRDYDSIMEILLHYEESSFSDIAPQLMMDVFKHLPNSYKVKYPYIYLKWITDCITNFSNMQGPYLLEEFRQHIKDVPSHDDKQQLYGEYYFILAFLSFNDVFAMMDAFKKAYDFFRGSTSKFAYPFMITSFGSCHMLFLYYNQSSRLKEIKDYIVENIHYFIHISKGLHTGTSNLIKAEYLYETGMYRDVSTIAQIAFQEAMEKNQISGAICCLFLLGRNAHMQHDQLTFKHILQQLHDFYKVNDSPIIHSEIDCALSYLYILKSEYNNVSNWLKSGLIQDAYTLPEGRMMAYIIHGLYLLRTQSMNALQDHIQVINEYNKLYSFIFAEIFCKIFEVVIKYNTGYTQNAWEQFKSLMHMCSQDNLYSILIEFSDDLNYYIMMLHSSSPFEETFSKLLDAFREEDNIPNLRALSPKEEEILFLYGQGKRVKEIAVLKNISINTVQFHLKSIYRKLEITSKSELTAYYFKNYVSI